jgi:hypothetical protein
LFASLRHRAWAQSALCGGDPECVCESLAFEGRKKKNVFRTQFSTHALRAERLLRRTASLHFSLQPRLSYSHQSRGEKLNVRALYGSDLMDYDFNFIPGRCSPPLPLLLKINFSALCARLLMPGTLDCEKWLRGVTQMRRRRLNIECNFLLGKSCVRRGWREKSALCTVISACVALDARKGRSRSLLTLRRGRNLSLRKITAHTRSRYHYRLSTAGPPPKGVDARCDTTSKTIKSVSRPFLSFRMPRAIKSTKKTAS